jgi:mycothiol synthase
MTAGPAFDWRPLEPGDARNWAALMAAMQATEGGWLYLTEQDLLEEFSYPDRDLARGSAAIYDGAALAGYGLITLRSSADPVHEVRFEGGVHPRYRGRGLGGRLLDWAETAVIPLHQERYPGRPMSMSGEFLSANAAATALYAARGYGPVRRFHGMFRELTTGLPEDPVPAPPGVDIVSITPDRHEDARLVRNEAFRDHWGSTETTAEAWAHFMVSHAYRPALSFLAYADDEPLGLIIGQESDGYARATGVRDLDIPVVGTRRAGRKRGIAMALLLRAMSAARAAGYASASLGVDADSPTGAVGLYQRAGFTIDHTSVIYLKPVLE